jgi:hypothetical protein
MFKQKQIAPTMEVKKEVQNPKLTFEMTPDNIVKVSVFWEDKSNFNVDTFIKMVDLVNSGELYGVIKKSLAVQGGRSGDGELANLIAQKIKDPKQTSKEDDKPIISASHVTKYHFNQHLLNLQNGGVA